MPTLPQYISRSQPSGSIRGGPSSSVDVSGLVRGVSHASDQFQMQAAQQEQERKKLAEDEAKVTVANTVSQAHSMWTEKLQAAQQGAPEGAPGFTAGVLKEFDAWSQKAADEAPELGRKTLQILLAEFRTNMHGAAFKFETGARNAKVATDFDKGLDADRRLVWADPSQFQQAAANRVALARSLSLPADVKSKLVENATGALAFDAAMGSTERDPDGMLTKLGIAPGKWQPGMPLPDTAASVAAVTGDPVLSNLAPERLQAVLHRALSLSASRDASNNAAGDKALREAEKAHEQLQKFALSGELASPEYQAQVLAVTAGTPYAETAKQLLAQSTSGAAFGAQSLPRQAASLRSIETQLATAGTNPEALEMVRLARTIHDNQQREYKENPWAAATRFGRLPAVPEAQIQAAEQVPQLITQRLPAIGNIETLAGRPVSPLQPEEAEAFASRLKALPVEQRGPVLAQAGDVLTIERIGALAEQLDKHDKAQALALKIGSGKTAETRAAAGMILGGSQALADKRVKRDDMALTGWRSEIAGMIRGTLGDAQAEQDAIDAAYFVRAYMDTEGAALPGGGRLDTSNEGAVRLVLGQPYERGGVRTVLPRGMDEDAFVEKVRGFSPEVLKTMVPSGEVYLRGQKRTLNQLASALPGMGMRRSPDGSYLPVSAGAFVTLDAAGTQPLRLDIR